MMQICKRSVTQHESDLIPVVHSLIRSMKETNLEMVNSGPCYASCIRFYLAKLMRLSGYDASVCTSKWQRVGIIPGGMPIIIMWLILLLLHGLALSSSCPIGLHAVLNIKLLSASVFFYNVKRVKWHTFLEIGLVWIIIFYESFSIK